MIVCHKKITLKGTTDLSIKTIRVTLKKQEQSYHGLKTFYVELKEQNEKIMHIKVISFDLRLYRKNVIFVIFEK